MPVPLLFLLSTLLLAAGFLAAFAVSYLPATANLLWVLAVLFLSLGLGTLVKKLSVRYLFLAAPLAMLPALAVMHVVWPAGRLSLPNRQEASPVPLQEVRLKVPARFMAPVLMGRQLMLPAGWQISVYAAGLGPVRMLTFDQHGVLLASLPEQGRVLALPDEDHDGQADQVVVFAEGLSAPHGLAPAGDTLWVAGTGALYRLRDRDNDLHADEQTMFSSDLPGRGGHWTRSIVVARDGSLLVSAGSSCNACLETDVRRAAIMRFVPPDPQGTLFATGLRNSVGLAIEPETGELWASDNGRDRLGDDLPPDEINHITAGSDYGWPYCFGARVPDPQLGNQERCRDTVPAAVELQAHSAPLGIAFMPDSGLLARADELLLVAYHGSWNRTVPTGYKLVAIPFHHGRPSGAPFDLVRGWLEDGQAWGRPVSPVVAADGAILLSDDTAGVIYRIVPAAAVTNSSAGPR